MDKSHISKPVVIEILGMQVTVPDHNLKELASTGETYVDINDGADLMHIKHVGSGYGFHTYHHGSTLAMTVNGLPVRR